MALVFVYGTLTDPRRVSTLLDSVDLGPEAVCYGLTRVDGRYPTLCPGDRVCGRLLATPEISRLDDYEGVDRGLYCRCSIPLDSAGGSDAVESAFDADSVETYIGDPAALGVSERVDWPGSGSLERRVAAYIETNPVRVRPETGPETTLDDL
ncbi:MAG: gamma-glutamylcyclotransferase [Halohasta sp.]